MSSIGGFDTFSANSALSLLNSMGSTGGMFGAISGTNASATPTISALGVSVVGANAGQTIQQLAQNQSIQTQKNNIYKTIADQINAVATGQIQPTNDWQKLGGYYAGIGTPFVITLDSKGQPAITSQDQMDASRYSVTQRNTLSNAITTLQQMAPEVQANTTYTNLQNQWNSISVNLVDIKNNNMVPTTDWQQQAATIMASNHPISFALDPNGTVSVEDQTVSTFQDQDPSVRAALTKASRIAGDAVSTDLAYNNYLAQGVNPPQSVQDKETLYSQYSWVQDASSYAAMGIPYTLTVDPSQVDTSVNYVTKTEKTTYSNGLPNATNSFTINNTGLDGFGYPDTTTDSASPQPFAAANRITTSISGITDALGSPINPINYTNPVNIVSSAPNALAVTDTVTGNTDAFSYDGAGTLTVTTTNKQGTQIGLNTYNATGLAAVASEPPTVNMVDGSGKSILATGSGVPVSYSNPVSVNKIDQYNLAVTNTATGAVDTYSTQLDALNNPIQDAKGNYLLSLSHTDSLGRTIAPTQTLASSAPGISALTSTPNSMTIAADGVSNVSISKQTILPVDKYASAVGSNGNKLQNIVTDGSGNRLATYATPVSIANNGAGTIMVTDKSSGIIDTYTDNGNNTISISHQDAAGDVVKAGSTVAGAGLNAVAAETPVVKFTDGGGSTILDSRGVAIPSYANPVTVTNTGAALPDKSFTVTDSVTGSYDTYDYTDSTGNLSIGHFDNQGNQLYTQTASGVTGFNVAAGSPTTITDAAGGALTDTLGNAAPTYTAPISFKDTGAGNFSITNSATGYVDQYAYDSVAQTLTITHNDNANNTLSTQDFTGVAGVGKPWVSMADQASSSWSVTPTPASVTDASGAALTDTLGAAAPTYGGPVTIADSGGGNFSITDNATGYVDKYAYDSTSQSLTITHNDNANNTLSSQSFTGVNGIKAPWAAQQAASPTNWAVSPPGVGVTNSLGGPLTDTLGAAAPAYTSPVTVADSGGGIFAVTDNATGYVDKYAYDSTSQSLTITHNDNANNTLSTQSFTGVNGITSPWAAQQAASPTSWSVGAGSTVTDPIGGTLTDTLGSAAPTYANPVTVADAGGGNFSITDSVTGYVDQYAYDSATQSLTITQNDNANNVLATQSFTGLTGLGVPWAAQQAASPTSWAVSPPPVGVTDAAGGALTDTLGTAAPGYTSPVTVADAGGGNFSVTDNNTGYDDKYAYDSTSQSLTITHNDNANNTLSTQSFTGVTGIATPWAAQQAASPTSWAVTLTPAGLTDGGGGPLTDTMGAAAPTYTDPIAIKDFGGGKFAITDKTTGYVDQYAYDSVAQTLSITHNDNNNNTLSTQSFTGVTGVAGFGLPAASLLPNSPTNWDVFNKTTLHSALASISSYNTSYDTSNFDMTNPASHIDTANAYTSSTTFSYTNNNINDPQIMQSAMPNLQVNYVTTPKITVMAVTDVPMPTTVEPATAPYDINTNNMPKWESDAIGYMKAGTPYMLDFNQQGSLVSNPLTGDNVVKFNNPLPGVGGYNPNALSSSTTGLTGVALMLSTVA